MTSKCGWTPSFQSADHWTPQFSDQQSEPLSFAADDQWMPTFEDRSKWFPHFGVPSSAMMSLGSQVVVTGHASDYNQMHNRPAINGVELVGNKTNAEIYIGAMSNKEIEEIIKRSV